MKKELKSLGDYYHAGWDCSDANKLESYREIINHLAEDTNLKFTPHQLAEVCGYLLREHEKLVQHLNGIQSDLLLLSARSLASSLEYSLVRGSKPKLSQSSLAAVGAEDASDRLEKIKAIIERPLNGSWRESIFILAGGDPKTIAYE